MINYLSKPFRWFKLEAASGLVLLFVAIIALIISNSTLSDIYFSTLDKYLFIGINNFGLNYLFFIGSMMLNGNFLFLLHWKLKENFLGELSNIKKLTQLLLQLVECLYRLYFMFLLILGIVKL